MTIQQYKFRVSLVLWNHNNGETADLAMIQQTNIDTLHKEGKSRRSLLKGVAVYRVLYQSILKAKLTGRKNLGRKRCTSNRDDRKLENTVKQADSNTCESFTRSGLKLESVHQESPRSDVFRKRATKPLLNQRQRQKHLTWAVEKKNWTVAQWSKVLFSDESKCCISFGNQGPRVWRRVERHRIHVALKSSVKFPQSVMIWAAMSSAGVGPLCFSEVHSQRSHLPGNFRALHASFCWQALWRCWFHFPAGLGTCPHCQRYQKLVQWPWCLLCLIGQQTRLTWTP